MNAPRPVRLLLIIAAFLPQARAETPRVDSRLTVSLIHLDGQSETSRDASNAKPGDVLEYAVQYSNRGDGVAPALMPTMPIPVGTEYLPGDRGVRPTHASLDGTGWEPFPLRRTVRGRDGSAHAEDVPLREYRALRWSLGNLAPGSRVTVRARVRVAPAPARG